MSGEHAADSESIEPSASEYQSRQKQQQSCVSEIALLRYQVSRLAEIGRIITYYCNHQEAFVLGLCLAINKAKETVQKAGELQDNSFWSDLATTVVVSAVGFIPGGAGFASILMRWGANKVSSELIETISSGIAKFLAEKGISSSAGNISDISSNLALSDKAFELEGVLRENCNAERTSLNNMHRTIDLVCINHPEIINVSLLLFFQQLENKAPQWTARKGDNFVYHFEKKLWPTWIKNNCYIYKVITSGNTFRELKGLSDEAINYLNNKFGWDESTLMTMVTRVETVVITDSSNWFGFGGYDIFTMRNF